MSDERILIVDDGKMIMLHVWISELPRKSKVNEPDFFVETVLFRRGDPPTSLYLVKSGTVEISTRNRLGQKVVLDIQKSGNFFGEFSLLLNRSCMTDAKTTRPSELLELTKTDFEACLVQFLALQSTMQGISADRLIRIEEVFSQEGVEKAREAMV